MKIREVMSAPVVIVAPATPFKELIETLLDAGVSGLPVVDGGRVVGMVTEADLLPGSAYARRPRALWLVRDLLSGRRHGWLDDTDAKTAADVMTADVYECGPDEDLRVVARRMRTSHVKRLPVIDEGVLVGIVSRHDVLGAFDRPDDLVAADVEAALHTDPNRPDDAHVVVSVEGGVVTLSGDVRYPWDEPVVVGIAHGVEGAIAVTSHLHARERVPPRRVAPWPFVAR